MEKKTGWENSNLTFCTASKWFFVRDLPCSCPTFDFCDNQAQIRPISSAKILLFIQNSGHDVARWPILSFFMKYVMKNFIALLNLFYISFFSFNKTSASVYYYLPSWKKFSISIINIKGKKYQKFRVLIFSLSAIKKLNCKNIYKWNTSVNLFSSRSN